MRYNPCYKYFHFLIIGVVFFAVSVNYNIMFDLCILALLFTAAYSIGIFVPVDNCIPVQIITKIACGLGVIGVTIYFLLLLGVGSKSLYIILLITPIAFAGICKNAFDFKTLKNIYNQITLKHLVLFEIIACILVFYIICGSAPISSYDSLTKHLPITIYAGTSGEWYTNLIESIVYGECMLLQYTYSSMLYSFGAYKALTLFNVLLFFMIFMILIYFCKAVYKKTNILLLALIYFSTPMFFEYSRIFYLEMLNVYFVFAAITLFTKLNSQSSWKNLPVIAWLFGCSLFTKLTTSYFILVVGIIVIILACIHYKRENTKYNIIFYFFLSGMIFVLPFLTSVIITYYQNGNPLLPMFNGIFKSPYFGKYNFVDPFNPNPLGLNIESLISIVFNTSQNVEMSNGGLGLYLLLLWVIPIGIIISKNKALLIWSAVPIISFGISCLFTYNLRYSLALFMMVLAIIIVNISIFYEKIFTNIKIKHISFCATAIILIVPNILYINQNYNIKELVTKNENITNNSNQDILAEVPIGKKVFSVNDPFKGAFQGFYSSYMWHNSVILQMIENNNLSLNDYVSSFDYVLYKKNEPIENAVLENLIEYAGTDKSILIPYIEKRDYTLYVVSQKDNYTLIKDHSLASPIEVNLNEPIFCRFDNLDDLFQIEENITNEYQKLVKGRFQINWYDENDTLIDVYIDLFDIVPGTKTYTSMDIVSPDNALYGVLLINTDSEKTVTVNSYKLRSVSKRDYIDELTNKYYDRYFLNQN